MGPGRGRGIFVPPGGRGGGFGFGEDNGGVAVGGGGGGGGQVLGGGGHQPGGAGGIDLARTVESRFMKKPGVEQECQICQGVLNDGDTIRTLPCMHVFHGECLEEWVEHNQHCPNCK